MKLFVSLWGTLLILALFVPVVYIVGRKIGKHAGWLSFIPLIFVTMTLISFLPQVLDGFSLSEGFVWVLGIRFGLLVDGLSLPVAFTVALLSTLIIPYSIPYVEHRIHEEYAGENKRAYATYYALYLLFAAGMIGVALATNLFEFFLFYELMIVPAWALINVYGYHAREKIAFIFFLWMEASAILVLTGILIAYTRTGSFEISNLTLLSGDPWAIWVIAFILLGFLIKMAVFGLHIWLPYAHAEAPAPVSALLSPAMIGLAAYAIVRILVPIRDFGGISLVVLLWALATMIYGGLMALNENDIKRLLAYSSISQMGYLLLGISSYTTIGVGGSMLHYVAHGLGKAILFLAAGAIIYRTGIRDIRQMGGLASKMPILATVFVIGFITIAGVPPTFGFMSKWLIFTGVFGRGLNASSIELALAFSAMFATVLTVAYALWTIRRIFYGTLPTNLEGVKEPPKMMLIPLLTLSVLSLLLFIYPRIILDPLLQVINSLISR